jgi:hypothetical protein|nr:MAG TPA: protein of unknown function (DUF4406) [Caudoviricetes sp.]
MFFVEKEDFCAKMAMRLFISQPMRGKTDEQILDERNYAISRAKKILGDDVEVIDSFFNDVPTDTSPLWYLGESIKLLATADIVYFCDGWDTARGCRIEQMCAADYGINTMYD